MTAVPAALALAALLAVAAAAPDLEQLGKCSDKCIRTFDKCLDQSDWIDDCVFDKLLDCHCDCRKYLQAMRAALPRTEAGRDQVAEALPVALSLGRRAGLPASLPVQRGGSEQAQEAFACFAGSYLVMNMCAEPCIEDEDVECAMKCVVPGFDAICGCNTNRPVDPTPSPAPGPSTTAGPNIPFTQCHLGCLMSGSQCKDACGDDEACRDQCVFTVLDCDCNCKQYIDGSRSLSAFVASLKQQQQQQSPSGRLGKSQAAAEAEACHDDAIQEMYDCTDDCSDGDDACIKTCAHTSFQKICNCASAPRPEQSTVVPPPTVDPSGSAYAQFGQCHAGCQGRFKPCVAACSSAFCIDQCVFDVIDCDCGCKKYVDSARGLLEQRRRRTPAVLSRGLAAALAGLGSEESELAARCYDESIETMNDCTDSCASGDEACASRCAKMAFTTLCTCSVGRPTTKPPTTTVMTTMAPPRPPTPLDLFSKCHVSCLTSYRSCQTKCKTDGCIEQCVYDFIVDCNCACKKHLDGSSMLAFVASTRGQAHLSTSLTPFGSDRSMDDANYSLKCYNDAVDEMQQCTVPCIPTHDEACAIKCVKPAFEKICHCNRLQPGTTSKPAPPTRPPTTPPRPRPPTVPPTTAQPPATTPASAGGLQGHLLVVAATALLALLARP